MTATPLSPQALLALASTDALLPLDFRPVLAAPPFVSIPGTFNSRDIGLVPGSRLKPGLFFRTGLLNGLTDEGKRVLRDELGVRTIYDLRSVEEHRVRPDPVVEGVRVVAEEPGEGAATVELERFVEGEGEAGYEWMYLKVMDMYDGGLRALLRGVMAGEGGVLFHCNAGRDRTGVAAALLLALAGSEAEVIELDFMLSRIGTEPAREQLMAFAMKGSGAMSIDAPGFRNMVNLRVSCWRRFAQAVERVYGGWEGYVTGTLGFSADELAIIKKNLTRED